MVCASSDCQNAFEGVPELVNGDVRASCMQLDEYSDQYTEMLKTFWPHFAESMTPEQGAQRPEEVRPVDTYDSVRVVSLPNITHAAAGCGEHFSSK